MANLHKWFVPGVELVTTDLSHLYFYDDVLQKVFRLSKYNWKKNTNKLQDIRIYFAGILSIKAPN